MVWIYTVERYVVFYVAGFLSKGLCLHLRYFCSEIYLCFYGARDLIFVSLVLFWEYLYHVSFHCKEHWPRISSFRCVTLLLNGVCLQRKVLSIVLGLSLWWEAFYHKRVDFIFSFAGCCRRLLGATPKNQAVHLGWSSASSSLLVAT